VSENCKKSGVERAARAEREPVEFRHQDLGDHDGGPESARELEGRSHIRCSTSPPDP